MNTVLRKSTTQHFPTLNGFRALALFVVIFHHIAYSFCLYNENVSWLILRIAQLGFLGVDIFFVLSGFLISGLLLKDLKTHGSIQLFRFYSRRAFKIIPHYLTILLAGAIYFSISAKQILPYLYFMQNYAPPFTQFGHLWSIAVEEHFYIILPLILALISNLFKKQPTRAYLGIYLLLIVLGNALRFFTLENMPLSTNNPTSYQMTHLRFDALIFGCLLRTLYEQPSFFRLCSTLCGKNILFIMGAVIYIYIYIFGFLNLCWWHYTIVYSASGCLILAALCGFAPLKNLTETPVLDYIGRSSYGIYLWHFLTLLAIAPIYKNTGQHPVLLISIYLLLTFPLGILTTKTIERYFLHLRERIFA